MSDNIKLQDTEYPNESVITKTDIITKNYQTSSKQEFNKVSLSSNNSKSQEELSHLILNFNKINIKEIDPTLLLSKQVKFSAENMIIDEIYDFIYKINNKGIETRLEQQVIEYLSNHNINSQEFYDFLLNNQINTNSIFILGYFNYYEIITSQSHKKAFELFTKASEKNHLLAQLFVGFCYFYGNGTKKNQELAFEYFEKVANKNIPSGQVGIGYSYERIKKDSKKAFYWYEKASNNGNIIAMYNLGLFYKNGIGVEENYNKSFEMFKQSAEGGYSGGITMLGYCYKNGIGIKINKQKAFELYQNAANLGHVVAQNNLALMYEKGDGITKDIDKAIYWFEKSAKKGYELAKSNLKLLQNES
jgi:TPR repeat protein